MAKPKEKEPAGERKALFFRPPPELRQRLRVYVAAKDNITMQDVLVEALAEYLKKRGA